MAAQPGAALTMTEIAFVALTAAGAIACWLLFLLPSLVAFQHRHPRRWTVFGVNLLLGATGVGWLVALIWARQVLAVPSSRSRNIA